MRLTDILQKTESYDTYGDRARCNSNGTITATKEALQENDTFIKRKQIDGTYKYYWNDTFINKLINSLATGEYDNFGVTEKTIAENYVKFVVDGQWAEMPEYIIPLDTWIGEIE